MVNFFNTCQAILFSQGKNNYGIFIAGKSDSFGNFPIFLDSFPESSPICEENGKLESYPIFLENLKV